MGHFSSSEGNTSLDFSGVTTGISAKGMEDYMEKLHMDVLKKVEEKLKATEAINDALVACWQGAARDKFAKKFSDTVDNVIDELNDEYADLVSRLYELQENYFKQDAKMLDNI